MKRFKLTTIKKLVVLLIVTMFGFIYMFMKSHENIKDMKQSIDIIYFGSYVQSVRLGKINESYSQLLHDTSLVDYTTIRATIIDNWNEYYHSYQSKDEKRSVVAVDDLIAKTIDRLEFVSNDEVLQVVAAVNKIIKYEKDVAWLTKQTINDSVNATQNGLFYATALTIMVILILAYFIIISVQKSENKLYKLAATLSLLNNELKTESITDPLTGLYNRRYFNEIFDKELKKAYRGNYPIAFMMIDVDNFKKYNDNYGHQMGDEVLQVVAKTMQSTFVRPEDYVFRLGGEEFGVVISNITKEQALLKAKELVRNVEANELEHKKNDASKYVTISLGLYCEAPVEETSVDSIIKIGDDLLYKAKDEGRNQVQYL